MAGNTTWFNKPKEQSKIGQVRNHPRNHPKKKESMTEACMRVPHTPGGALKAKLTKMEEGLDFVGRVRYTEDLGSTLETLLVRDPWKSI